jgi:hypothetical protein
MPADTAQALWGRLVAISDAARNAACPIEQLRESCDAIGKCCFAVHRLCFSEQLDTAMISFETGDHPYSK